MYNAHPHRGVVTTPSNRFTELLDQVRTEFENQAGRAGEYEHQSMCDSTTLVVDPCNRRQTSSRAPLAGRHEGSAHRDSSVSNIIAGLTISQPPLVATQMSEMDLVRQKLYQLEQTQMAIKQRYEEEISQLRRQLDGRGGPAQPPHLGGPHDAGPAQAQPPSIGHGPSNLFGGIMAQPGGQGLAPPPQEQPPPHQMPQPPPPVQQPGPPQAQQAPFPGYQSAPAVNGYPPQSTASPGPGKGRNNRGGPPGPATPQQSQQPQYPDPRASPQIAHPTPPPQHQISNVGNNLGDLELDRLPPHQKKEVGDWHAVFNPRVRRVLDVNLVHTLPHESVVCCVRFSHDGRYVATGCNRAAQIFDVTTGEKVTSLEDSTVDKDGDLYIRSVCFSPDGRYLATGAEDKQIRVWDIQSRTIKYTFTGHEQDIYSLDFSRSGRHIASGSGDRTVRLWDLEAGQCFLTLQIEDGVTTVAISPDSRYVAAGSLDKSVRVWDTQSGYLVERLEGPEGHKDSVYSVAFAPNGKDLVSGSLDKTIKMWELSGSGRGVPPNKGGRCLRTFEGHKV
ncbi:MAG: general transcription repressor [Sclerophora amabilis]|nr:MAG: general transcription repressor [Sclerophora amabilis]